EHYTPTQGDARDAVIGATKPREGHGCIKLTPCGCRLAKFCQNRANETPRHTTDALGGTAFYGLNSNPKYHPHVRKCPTYRQEDAWLNRANRKRDGAYCARG